MVGEGQRSMINIEQMRDSGASRKWIERRANDGLIIRDGPSGFRMPGVPRPFASPAAGRALVSHRSAAYLHGFERVLEPLTVEITVPRHRRPRHRAGIRVHESLAFDLAEPTERQGIPVTGVARTILDCAPMFDRPVGLLDDALRRRIVNWDELGRCCLGHTVAGRDG